MGYFVLQALERPLLAPIVWPYETQKRFVDFLAGHRITFAATVSRNPDDVGGRRHLVQFEIHATSALADSPLNTELVVHQEALFSIVRFCCHHFPGLARKDWESAWQ